MVSIWIVFLIYKLYIILKIIKSLNLFSDVIAKNHKGQTDMLFYGISLANWNQRNDFQLFDGSKDQPQQYVYLWKTWKIAGYFENILRYHWGHTMTVCVKKGPNWRTYSLVVWDNNDKNVFEYRKVNLLFPNNELFIKWLYYY